MVAAGLFLLVFASLKSDFLVYRLLVYRSKMLWGKNAHRFHQVVGAIVIVLGVLWALGFIW